MGKKRSQSLPAGRTVSRAGRCKIIRALCIRVQNKLCLQSICSAMTFQAKLRMLGFEIDIIEL